MRSTLDAHLEYVAKAGEIGVQTNRETGAAAHGRFVALDSLRGLAAFTVMIHHYLLTFPAIFPYGQQEAPVWVRLLTYTPLHLFWAGYEAVLLFFMMSGFVLSLPYQTNRPLEYGSFVIRRWARIWWPYVVVVTMAGACGLLLQHLSVPGLSIWFANAWAGISLEGYLNHLLLIGNLDQFSTQFIPVVWTLRYEMLASLAFPLLLWLSRSLSWPVLLLLGAALNYLGIHYSQSLRPFEFVVMFLVDILLSRHREFLVAGFRRMPRLFHVPLLALAFTLYLSTWLSWHADRPDWESSLLDLAITAAAVFAIVTALASRTAHALLSLRAVVWLGRVSYSLPRLGVDKAHIVRHHGQ
ncbi:acyltransferase [Deinococcus radiomollis]|uniref:acyltransferase family protein n=1 Tax=Deinococcus radiomollis TaxID=468916 RepID=UPI0038925FBF